MAYRPSATSNIPLISRISTTSIRTRRRAARSPPSASWRAIRSTASTSSSSRAIPAQGLGLLFDTLMTRANDEPDAMYGLVAKTVDLAADKKSMTFQLRAEAKFSDGTPVTADDVCETFRLLMAHAHERIRLTIKDAERCDVLGPHEARFTFKTGDSRDLPLSIAALPVFSKAYYSTHDFTKADLQPPLGSGPYKIGSFRPGEYVAYMRRDDYWAKDLPVNRGRYNFDEIRYEYYRNRTAGFEALKGGVIDLREENVSREWQTAYDFAAVKDGRVLKTELPDETPSGAQGFFFNLRRDKFQDIRVRQALNLAFDFEWTNANLFYGLYDRTASFFEKSALKAEGAPSAEELRSARADARQVAAGGFRRDCGPAKERRLRPGPQDAARRLPPCSTRQAGSSTAMCAAMPRASPSPSKF